MFERLYCATHRNLLATARIAVAATVLPAMLAGAALAQEGATGPLIGPVDSPAVATANSAVALGPAEEVAVAWLERDVLGSDWRVMLRRFDSNGTPTSSSVAVESTADVQPFYRPGVGITDAGDILTVWTASDVSTDGTEVMARWYDDTLSPQGPSFVVNTYTTSNQLLGGVASLPGGEFLVAWSSFGSSGNDNDGSSIQAARVDAAGAVAGSDFQVNDFTTNDQIFPAVATASDGGFVLAWRTSGITPGAGEEIVGRRFDSSATPLGVETVFSDGGTGQRRNASAAIAQDGTAFVAWWTNSSGLTPALSGVHSRRLGSDGSLLSGVELMSPDVTNVAFGDVALAATSAGGTRAAFSLSIWGSPDGHPGDYGRHIASDGTDLGGLYLVGPGTNGFDDVPNRQDFAAAARSSTERYALSWTDSGSGLEEDRVFARIYSPACPAEPPAAGCYQSGASRLQMKVKANGKNKLKWAFSKGSALTFGDIPDPIADASYTLCIYDTSSAAWRLATRLTIDRNNGWRANSKGHKYKDKTPGLFGVSKAKLQSGDEGKSKASVGAKGPTTRLPVPLAPDEMLSADPEIVGLLYASDGTCWETSFDSDGVKKNLSTDFKASARP